MISSIFHLLPQSYNQSDRIQGMARYMNQDGASGEGMTLLLIFAGMLSVILVLKWVAAHDRKKREAALRQRLAKKKAAEDRAASQAKQTKQPQGRTRRATRLR